MDREQRLVYFIQSLPQINLEETVDFGYTHMGAIITDAILQAGVNYKTVVAPKVQHILDTYPEAATTTGFLSTLDTVGPQRVLGWKDPEKINRIYDLTRFFLERGLVSNDDVREWLLEAAHVDQLRSVRGVGPKTVDYLKNLVGIPSVAVDRHIQNFLVQAGIEAHGYDDIRQLVERAAAILHVSPTQLDHAIWRYMSNT